MLFHLHKAVRKHTSIRQPETVLSVLDASVAKATVYVPELVCKNRSTSTFSEWTQCCRSQRLSLPVLVSRDTTFCPFPKPVVWLPYAGERY